MEYYPDDIATVLCKLAGNNDPDDKRDCEEAVHQLKAIAQNEYNFDHWRTFWRILETITEQEENR